MAAKDGERSASSATRFTATTPHASSKMGSGAATPKSRFQSVPGTGGPRKPPSPARTPTGAETPEQRVARLRAAHEAAKNAKVSRFDQILAKSRPFFDSAHRITVISLVGLTAVAGVMTAYTAYDMMRYNRQRKAEFHEVQKNSAADSLNAARLAYMRGEATDEQISMVEDASARDDGFKLPSILSAPKPIGQNKTEEDSAATAAMSEGQVVPPAQSSGMWGLFSSGSKKAEVESDPQQQQQPKSLEEKRAMLESARSAFEKEKENQKKGGPLDRLGTEDAASQPKDNEQPKKKGWLW